MLWFWLSLIHPLFFSVSNILDQVLVRKYFAASIPGFFILTGLSVPLLMIVLYLMYPSVMNISVQNALYLNLIGLLYVAFVYPYCHAIRSDDATVVVPIFDLAPVFVYLIGFFILGETISPLRLLGGTLIVAASVFIVWDFEKRQFRWRLFTLMIVSTLIYALMNIALRLAADFEWYVIIFWMMPAWIEIAIVFVLIKPDIFKEVISAIKNTKGVTYFLMLFAGTTDTVAVASIAAAISVAPATALVSLVGGIQPLILIGFGGMAAYIWPSFIERLNLGKALALKIVCGIIILVGLFLILFEDMGLTFGSGINF